MLYIYVCVSFKQLNMDWSKTCLYIDITVGQLGNMRRKALPKRLLSTSEL
jgi:hypothetical protein